jgi:AcrR family transcriptional regulator
LTRIFSPLLDPRKTPVQARSVVTVGAILSATIQVLLAEGQERLTTTRVAPRAGVSVGTLYQYFPNEKALLRAVLEHHLEEVASSVERACRKHHSCSFDEMASGVITAFLEAKMRSVRASAALYAIAADVDGYRISREAGRTRNGANAPGRTPPWRHDGRRPSSHRVSESAYAPRILPRRVDPTGFRVSHCLHTPHNLRFAPLH